jgi:hypothetical protein
MYMVLLGRGIWKVGERVFSRQYWLGSIWIVGSIYWWREIRPCVVFVLRGLAEANALSI